VANTLKSHRNGTVSFIDWLGGTVPQSDKMPRDSNEQKQDANNKRRERQPPEPNAHRDMVG
jgi:hypothetical protein